MSQRGARRHRVVGDELHARELGELGAGAERRRDLCCGQPRLDGLAAAFREDDVRLRARAKKLSSGGSSRISARASVDLAVCQQQLDLLIDEHTVSCGSSLRAASIHSSASSVLPCAREIHAVVSGPHRLVGSSSRARVARGGGLGVFAEVHELHAAEHVRDEIQRIEPAAAEIVDSSASSGSRAAVIEIAEETMARRVVGIRGDRARSSGSASSDLNSSLSSQPFAASTSGRFGLICSARLMQRLHLGLHVLERRAIERQTR